MKFSFPPLREPKPARKAEFLITPLLRLELPQIQVALDMDASVETICDIAVKSYAGGARIIEAGTPAIKRHGVDTLIPALKKAIRDYCERHGLKDESIIMADMKTMDVGHLEARIAYRAGADIVNVLGIGASHKIKEALSEAIRRDKSICIDLIQCDDPIAKIEEYVKEFEGFEDWVVIGLHRAISEQIKGRGIYEEKELIREAKRRVGKFLLSVAGGIKEGTAKDVVEAGADICVVGSAIYNSADPKLTTQRLLEEIRKACPMKKG